MPVPRDLPFIESSDSLFSREESDLPFVEFSDSPYFRMRKSVGILLRLAREGGRFPSGSEAAPAGQGCFDLKSLPVMPRTFVPGSIVH